MPVRADRKRHAAWILVLVVYVSAALLFWLHSEHARHDFPLDDAWIHRVYARAMAQGEGFAYNPGQQETGATSPLWVVLSAPAHWLAPLGETVPVIGVKLLGVVLGALAVVALARTLPAAGIGGYPAVAAAAVFAVEPRLHFAALSGMEIVLLVWLWLEAARAIVDKRSVTALAVLGLAVVARPEAALLVPLGLLAMVAVLGTDRRAWPPWWTWPLVVAPSAVWALYCRSVTGHWLPNTFYVKSRGFAVDLDRLGLAWAAATEHGWAAEVVFPVALVAAGIWLVTRRTGRSAALLLLLLVAPAVYLVGVVGTRDVNLVGFYWSRWTDPAALVLTAAAALGIGAVACLAPRLRRLPAVPAGSPEGMRLWAAAVACAITAAVLAVAAPGFVRSFSERRDRLSSDSRAIRLVNVAPALWIHENAPPEAVVGAIDAGASRYFGQRRTVDLVGLNNADLVFQRIDPASMFREIDWLMVFPSVLQQTGMAAEFETLRTFGVPEEEYTICPCPEQTTNVVARRVGR